MRVLIAGATGAIGKRLVPMLVSAGHEVTGTTRSQSKAAALESAGARAAVVDALDAEAIVRAVGEARPDVIVHELTAIPPSIDLRHFDRAFAQTNRLRTEGTDNLIAAALRSGVRRFVAQSFAGWPYAASGGAVKSEDDPLESNLPQQMRSTLEAIRHVETKVTQTPGIEGIVLRYAMLYGPASVIGPGIDDLMKNIRKRMMPVVGSGAGVWSFVHVDDAAAATLLAVERGKPGIYNVADDDPAPAGVLFPELARLAGAKPPRHVPVWLAKFLIGPAGVRFMTEMRGASNAKAKSLLGWKPRFASWREGFRSGLS